MDIAYVNICSTFYYFIAVLDGYSRSVVHWDIREAMTEQDVELVGMSHVRTSPYYPQSNGKLERFHGTLKRDCIRPKTPVSLADAKRVVAEFVEVYNTQRLHSAIGYYITPRDKLHGREQEIFATRDRKLETARARRKAVRERALEAT
jgi:transposase InsO family protein